MAWNEKPPMLTGQSSRDLANLRDYLFSAFKLYCSGTAFLHKSSGIYNCIINTGLI